MLENQFIQFSEEIDPLKKEAALQTRPNEEICFQVFDLTNNDVKLVTADGTREIGNVSARFNEMGNYTQCAITYTEIAPNEAYRIKLQSGGETCYSNMLINDPNADLSLTKYWCKENAFGFAFGQSDNNGEYLYIQQQLPIKLFAPQYKQEDKVYTKLNGEQVVLYASITKEYDGETDYIPMEWHEKILMALSCDEVYINGERVTKSGNYEIDHDNCTYTDCGIKLIRATFKVTTNVTQRNSNY